MSAGAETAPTVHLNVSPCVRCGEREHAVVAALAVLAHRLIHPLTVNGHGSTSPVSIDLRYRSPLSSLLGASFQDHPGDYEGVEHAGHPDAAACPGRRAHQQAGGHAGVSPGAVAPTSVRGGLQQRGREPASWPAERHGPHAGGASAGENAVRRPEALHSAGAALRRRRQSARAQSTTTRKLHANALPAPGSAPPRLLIAKWEVHAEVINGVPFNTARRIAAGICLVAKSASLEHRQRRAECEPRARGDRVGNEQVQRQAAQPEVERDARHHQAPEREILAHARLALKRASLVESPKSFLLLRKPVLQPNIHRKSYTSAQRKATKTINATQERTTDPCAPCASPTSTGDTASRACVPPSGTVPARIESARTNAPTHQKVSASLNPPETGSTTHR
ncbi:hypothetical protein ON010_g3692 [Phytophthora cinnamomi]|nr:hypothetical protein ON010_g3692 [Phytophthora cinnamomi]